MEKKRQELRIEQIPLLPLRGFVVFPKTVIHFDVGRKMSMEALQAAVNDRQLIFLVAQKDITVDNPVRGDLFDIGVVATVKQVVKLADNTMRVLVEGKYRAKLLHMESAGEYATCQAEEFPTKPTAKKYSARLDALMRTVQETFEEYASHLPKMPNDMLVKVFSEEQPHKLVEYIAGNILLKYQDKQRLLEESSAIRRLEALDQILEREAEVLQLEDQIENQVREQMDKSQREYYLREQMKVIAGELGEGDDFFAELDEYREKIKALQVDEESKEKLLRDVQRMAKMPSAAQENAVLRGYLDTVLELPFGKKTKDKVDIARCAAQLDKDHYGLQKVKERILEILAVRKLKEDVKGQIICLVGPPGVGKTSIASSIAKAMGRRYVRVSLGGVKDESEIRGHRKTYVGAMPGRIITALKQAGSQNPLILFDEIDKMSNDFRGDPASAMLEVLDSEQNFAFRDHFIEIPFDLSDVLFITTANTLDTIPQPLLDRMEVIELGSYTREEKEKIAAGHLVPKQMEKNGLKKRQLHLTEDCLYAIIDSYTREAGVRSLERVIGKLCRKAAKELVTGEKKRVTINAQNIEQYLGAKRFRPEELREENEVGVVTGLAWTSVGGVTMPVEVLVLDGNGKIELTGSLGDVMKESAKASVSYIRSIAKDHGIEPTFYKTKDIHIHCPEGAVPKDGPSAGVTMCTALYSALTGIPVRRDVAMTGEISLRGKVMAIGGLREKTMAAYRIGVHTVIIPEENLPDLEEVEQVVKDHVHFVPASDLQTVFRTALVHTEQVAATPRSGHIPAEEKRGKTFSPRC